MIVTLHLPEDVTVLQVRDAMETLGLQLRLEREGHLVARTPGAWVCRDLLKRKGLLLTEPTRVTAHG